MVLVLVLLDILVLLKYYFVMQNIVLTMKEINEEIKQSSGLKIYSLEEVMVELNITQADLEPNKYDFSDCD